MERVEQKNKELADKNTTVTSYLAKVVSASEDRSRVEGQLREANGKCAAFDAAKARLEQEAVLLQQHNEWLRSELQRKSEELLTTRKTSSHELLQSANELDAAKRDLASNQRELVSVKESLAASEAASGKRASELKAAREAVAAAEAHFDQELTTSRRLAELYKTQADGRGGKTAELEGVLQALRDHLRELKEEHTSELNAEKQARQQAEAALTEAKLNFDGRIAAAVGASNENLLPSATLNADATKGPAAAAGRTAGALLQMQLPDSSAAALRAENLTMTELYTKYAEAADAWRAECFERKRLQSTVDGMISELEQRAPMLAEQRMEYERSISAHSEMRSRLEKTTVEVRRMEADTKSAVADAKKKDREVKALEAQSADLSRQVKLLLHEVTELKGVPGFNNPGPQRALHATTGDATSVVTAELVDFKNINELHEQNKRQLEVIRALSLDQEEQGLRLKEQYQAEVDKIKQEANSALSDLENRKQKTQTMVEAIVRQRDMYKALYQGGGAANNNAIADADAAAVSLAAAAMTDLEAFHEGLFQGEGVIVTGGEG